MSVLSVLPECIFVIFQRFFLPTYRQSIPAPQEYGKIGKKEFLHERKYCNILP